MFNIAIDITGQRFGRIQVIARAVNIGKWSAWTCLCDCGVVCEKKGILLRDGTTKSCGCLMREAHTPHGHTIGRVASGTYTTWAGMKARCTRESNASWADYGGRGIRVCPRWMDFKNFLADMGGRPDGLTIERVNNDGDYEPSNCRWATYSEQALNRRPKRLRT